MTPLDPAPYSPTQPIELVGGPADGQKAEVDPRTNLYHVPTPGRYGWDSLVYRRVSPDRFVYEERREYVPDP